MNVDDDVAMSPQRSDLDLDTRSITSSVVEMTLHSPTKQRPAAAETTPFPARHPSATANVTTRKKAPTTIWSAKKFPAEENLANNIASWTRQARLTIAELHTEDDEAEAAWDTEMNEATARYEEGQHGSTKLQKTLDKIVSNRYRLDQLKSKNKGKAKVHQDATASTSFTRQAKILHGEKKRKDRECLELQAALREREEQLRAREDQLAAMQQKIAMLEGTESGSVREEFPRPAQAVPREVEYRQSWIRPNDEGCTADKQSGDSTKHRKPEKYSGRIYSDGDNFDAHVDAVKLKMQSYGQFSLQQEAEFFLSSLDEVTQLFARAGTSAHTLPPIPTLINNIRRFEPNAGVNFDKLQPVRNELAKKTIGTTHPKLYIAQMVDLHTLFKNQGATESELVSFGDSCLTNIKEQSEPFRRTVGTFEINNSLYRSGIPKDSQYFLNVCAYVIAQMQNDHSLTEQPRPKRQRFVNEGASTSGSNPPRGPRNHGIPGNNGKKPCKYDIACDKGYDCPYKHSGSQGEARDRERDERRERRKHDLRKRNQDRGYIPKNKFTGHEKRVDRAGRNTPAAPGQKPIGNCYKGANCTNRDCLYVHPPK
jgi:hypothetical protein